jgi:hypothetical protein
MLEKHMQAGGLMVSYQAGPVVPSGLCSSQMLWKTLLLGQFGFCGQD